MLAMGSRFSAASVFVWGALVLVLLAPAGCASWRAAQLYQSGTQALSSGEIEQAVSELERAARLQPDASEIQNHLGLAKLASGDHDAAEAAFERAVELDCDNDAARRNLASIGTRSQEGL